MWRKATEGGLAWESGKINWKHKESENPQGEGISDSIYQSI